MMAVNVERRSEQDDVNMLRSLLGQGQYAIFNYIHRACHGGCRPLTQILLLSDGRINFRNHWVLPLGQHREFSGPHGRWYLLHDTSGRVALMLKFSWQGIGGTMRTTRLSFNGESNMWIGHTAVRTWERGAGIDEVRLWFREMHGQGPRELQGRSWHGQEGRDRGPGGAAAPDRQGQGQGQEQGQAPLMICDIDSASDSATHAQHSVWRHGHLQPSTGYCRRVPSTQPPTTPYCTVTTLPIADATPDAAVARRGEAWHWLEGSVLLDF